MTDRAPLPAPARETKKWPKHPAGSHILVLADVLDPWFRVTEWKGKRKVQQRFALIWQSAKADPDTGKRFELATEFTYSVYETAALRPFLEGWLGTEVLDTETLAEELKGKGINVNAVLPTIIDTPANRAAMPDADPAAWVSPDDLANVICFLLSPAARAVHGALLPVRGLS